VYGNASFLFTGDAERPAEQDILEMGYDLSATVLKVGHHGSDTATTYPFLREIMPQYAVISCGEGNSYGHPHDDLLSRLRDADVTVYRTDLQGTIICVSDGSTVTFNTERNENAHTNPTAPSGTPAVSVTPSSSGDS
jgi:competence protein ComEC